MKHTLFILALITASIQTFAQSPRIKLNQITKDSVTGSVLISSPTDSGMVYSRDLFISYGADTFLILGGDTLAATSNIISSVLSDGVTITGNGTLGSELTVDTATVIATKQDLDLYYLDSNPDGYTSNTGTVTSVAATAGTGISVSGSPITTSGTLTITNTAPDQTVSIVGGGINAVSGTYPSFTVTGTEVDGDASNELQTLSYNSSTNEITLSDGGGTEDLSNLDLVDSTRINATGDTAYYYQNGVLIGTGPIAGGGGGTTYNNISETVDTVYIDSFLNVDNGTLYVDAINNRVGIGTLPTVYGLEVIGGILGKSTSAGGVAFVVDAFNGNSSFYFLNNGALNYNFGTSVGPGGGVNKFTIYNYNASATTLMLDDGAGNMGIGTTSPSYKLHVNGSVAGVGAYNNLSDVNWKKNIQDITYGLDKILQLKPITFNWLNKDYGDRLNIGFIAQEVEEIIPNMVTTAIDGTKSLAITDLIPVLTKAIQEQQSIIETQATEIEQLNSQIQLILSEIEQIKNN